MPAHADRTAAPSRYIPPRRGVLYITPCALYLARRAPDGRWVNVFLCWSMGVDDGHADGRESITARPSRQMCRGSRLCPAGIDPAWPAAYVVDLFPSRRRRGNDHAGCITGIARPALAVSSRSFTFVATGRRIRPGAEGDGIPFVLGAASCSRSPCAAPRISASYRKLGGELYPRSVPHRPPVPARHSAAARTFSACCAACFERRHKATHEQTRTRRRSRSKSSM
jgi:hypothetical protein